MFQRIGTAFCSRAGAYIFSALAAISFAFLQGSKKRHGWIPDVYPPAFIPVLLGVIGVCAAITFGFLLGSALSEKFRENRVWRGVYILFAVLAGIFFVYNIILLFGFDAGINLNGIRNGLNAIVPHLPLLGLALGLPLPFVFFSEQKKMFQAVLVVLLVGAVTISPGWLAENIGNKGSVTLPPITLHSPNLMEGASVLDETGGSAAGNLLPAGTDW